MSLATHPLSLASRPRVGLVLSVALALLCTAQAAQAAMESFNFSYGPDAIPAGSSVVGTLTQFDPSLGTLTEVDLTLNSTTSAGIIQFQNLAGVPATGTLGIGATVTITAPSALSATAVPLQTGPFSVTANVNSPGTYTGSDAYTLSGGSGSDSNTSSLFSSFGPYIGLGTFAVNGSSSLQTELITDGGYGPTNPSAGVTSGMVTVTYTYIGAPEPGSLALLGLGAIGLFFAARRSRKS